MRGIICLVFLFVNLFSVKAQRDSGFTQSYSPLDFFSQDFHPAAGNAFRSASGIPGPMYWQNISSYLIHATLSEKDTSITGDITISYTNNSPDKLDYLWLQLDQNLFNPSSRGAATIPANIDRFGVGEFKGGGYHIS